MKAIRITFFNVNRFLQIPVYLLLFVVGCLVLAFASAEQPAFPLCGTTWRATAIGGNPVKGRAPTLTINEEINGGRVSGSGGCNRYFSGVELGKENAIHFGAVASTRMACEGVEGVQESAYFKALSSASSYHLNNDYLVLLDSKFNKLVEFSAEPRR